MRIKWLFIVWMLLLCALGALFFILLPPSGTAFYVAESAVAVCLLFLYYFYRKAVKPLHTIGNAMDLLNEQDFSSRLAHVGQQDADRIVDLFNKLMEQLKNERLRVREQNHFLDLLIRVSPMGVILFDFDRRITGANAAALGFLGNMGESEVTGHMLGELSSPLAARLAGLPPGSVETVRLSDAMIYRCSHLSFVDRGYAHPFLLIESLTSEIVKAEKKTYEKVIRMIAHEVNNSVAAVTSTLDSLGEIVSPYDETGDPGHIIRVCSDRCYGMNRFIARLADIVRIPEPHLQTVRLNSRIVACRLLMEDACRRRNIRLQIVSDGDGPEVRLDPILFEQVMVNVVKNAAESIGADGEIIIRSGGNPAVVEIADNGSGIAKDDEEKLFTPFFSTKPDGQGIGLMLVREILDRHGCRFSLETGEDGWTRFTIRFPQGRK